METPAADPSAAPASTCAHVDPADPRVNVPPPAPQVLRTHRRWVGASFTLVLFVG